MHIVLFAGLMSIVFFTAPYDRELENNRLVYETYLEQVKGPLTQEKRAYLEEEMSRLNQVHRDMEELKQGDIPVKSAMPSTKPGFLFFYRKTKST